MPEIEKTGEGVVVLDYHALVKDEDLGPSIAEAYGFNGFGLLVVKNIPGLVEGRQRLLPLASQFDGLDDKVKETCTHAESKYSFGWSKGKEILKPGIFDEFKGSYYNNPQYDEPTTDPKMIEKYPEACLNNVWPSDEHFPELKPAFKELGQLIVQVGLLVARQCDRFVNSMVQIPPELQLHKVIEESRTCKARLLHYYAIKNDPTPRSRDSWCAWHNDHGSLTGLCSAMFMKEDDPLHEVNNPDPEAGLYARTRAGKEVKVSIPRDCLAFQIGETSQIVSGGHLMATPHAVQAVKHPEGEKYVRNTFAVFMQPNFDVLIHPPAQGELERGKVNRFAGPMTFGEYHRLTVGGYYQ